MVAEVVNGSSSCSGSWSLSAPLSCAVVVEINGSSVVVVVEVSRRPSVVVVVSFNVGSVVVAGSGCRLFSCSGS